LRLLSIAWLGQADRAGLRHIFRDPHVGETPTHAGNM
jgi:hypothetical protein